MIQIGYGHCIRMLAHGVVGLRLEGSISLAQHYANRIVLKVSDDNVLESIMIEICRGYRNGHVTAADLRWRFQIAPTR